MSTLELSKEAAAHIRALAEARGTPKGGMRLGVRGGGCSGLSYVVAWEERPGEKDEVVERDGGRVFVDPKSAAFLCGTLVDYKRTLMQSGLVFTNPNVKSSCGCGESFAV